MKSKSSILKAINRNIRLSFDEPVFTISTSRKTGKKIVSCVIKYKAQLPVVVRTTDGTPTWVDFGNLLPFDLRNGYGKSIGFGIPLGDDEPDVEIGMKVARAKAEAEAYRNVAALLKNIKRGIDEVLDPSIEEFTKKTQTIRETNKKYCEQF